MTRASIPLLAAILLVGCTSQFTATQTRWPNHRKQHDEQLEELRVRVADLEAKLRRLQLAQEAAPAPIPATPAR